MATQYPSNRSGDYQRPVSSSQPGISRSRSGYSSGRPAGARSASTTTRRPTTGGQRAPQRTSQRPSGQRMSGQRPSQRPPQRRPQPRRRKPQGRFYAFIAIVAVLLVAVILLVTRPGGGGDVPVNNTVTPTPTPAAAANVGDGGFVSEPDAEPTQQTQYADISQMLADTGNQVEGLSQDQMVKVEGLSVKEGLPSEWMNVLLLGTDERILSESGRTDAMMICSINRTTGEVKLTSIMRDLAVEYTNIGEYNGLYRINAANYFGGPNLAMKTVNELFDMNIQYYVMINFFGFGKIAQSLGGVEVDISEAEMKIINEDIVKQFKMAYLAGITDFDPEQKKLDTYGENIHLNGNQTLAYARIRHLEGGDYMRTTRQQTVLKKLLEKTKKLGIMDLVQLAGNMYEMVKTNMTLDDMIAVAGIVISNGIPDVDTLRLPIAKTYKEEVRNGEGMLYDCDFATNAVKLYDFIYE